MMSIICKLIIDHFISGILDAPITSSFTDYKNLFTQEGHFESLSTYRDHHRYCGYRFDRAQNPGN
jgi:hypothetical protein